MRKKGFLKEGLEEVEEEVGSIYQEIKHVSGKFTEGMYNNHVVIIYCSVLISLFAITPIDSKDTGEVCL